MKKILVIQTAFLGDVILATGLVETLTAAYPDAQIDFLVRKGNDGLLANNPHLDRVLVWDKGKSKLFHLIGILRSIRKERYDWVVNVHRFGSSGLLTALSKARVTSGFDKNPFSRFFTRRLPHMIGDGTHETERNQRLIDWMVSEPRRMPRVYPSDADREAIAPYQSNPYICIAPASVWFTKQFPAEKWVAFINRVGADYSIYLIGSPGDAGLCQQIQSQVQDPKAVRVLAGSLSLLQSAALMEGAIMNYVNDSAPLHLCSARNAPVTVVYCSTIPAFGFGPLSDKRRVVEIGEDLDCRPCGLHGYAVCPEGHFKCALKIRVEQFLPVNGEVEKRAFYRT